MECSVVVECGVYRCLVHVVVCVELLCSVLRCCEVCCVVV